MGTLCETKNNENKMIGSMLIRNDISLLQATVSLCKIITNGKIGSGFLIKLFKDEKDFFCLMTNEHVITKEMVENKDNFIFYFDNEKKTKEIKLDQNERYIKNFRDIKIDATIIEILPKDDISPDFFLLPNIDYMYNQKELINREIAVLQYPSGESCYSFGKIKSLEDNYEFAHLASTEQGSSGSPIFLKHSSKVIGIHKRGTSQNYGDFIGPIFNYFRHFSKNNIELNKNIKDGKNMEINIKNIRDKNKNINNNNLNEKNADNNKNYISNNILNRNKLNQTTIIYYIKKAENDEEYAYNKNQIKIFGKKFVENNKNNCYLLVNGKQNELCQNLILNEGEKNDFFKIKLIEKKTITNMSDMFYNCTSLNTLPDISEWDTKNVNNMSYMFSGCRGLISLPDISKWNTENVTTMSYMFSNCISLKTLPDISKWNTKNVREINDMFYDCDSLISLPDISKWNTNNVNNISCMFYGCSSLKILPDISKWNTKNVTNIKGIFSGCIFIPDITKLDTQNVTDMSYIFYNCKSIMILPNISKWNTKNVINMSYMFWGCKKLKSLPDLSKWNTKNVTNMSYMFYNCISLISLPDISKWELNKKVKTEGMFEDFNDKIIPQKFK